jgi:histidinol-phosphatase (PHP family)
VIVDYHMHLRHPRDDRSQEPLAHTVEAVERFVETARARGIDEIGFTEHVYYFRQTRGLWTLAYHLERCSFDLDAYVGVVLEAKRQGLPVKLGLEIDRVPGRQDELAEALAPYPWDYLLGSVHEVLDVAVDQRPGIWERLSVEEVWRGYVTSVSELAASGHVDVMSHPDLAKIYGHVPDPHVLSELHELLAAAFAEAGVAAEVSTAGLRKPIREIYPSEDLLRAFHRHGVPITIASDAHEPRYVGEDYGQALELVRRVGYDTVSVFDARERRQEPISP